MTDHQIQHKHLVDQNVDPDLISKWDDLLGFITPYGSAIIAYSGGVDSSFLAYAANLALPQQVTAITILSEFDSDEMDSQARSFARDHGIDHRIIQMNKLDLPEIRSNPVDRCYHCKLSILTTLWKIARETGIRIVFDGQNLDDQQDYRPGRKAIEQTHTVSPLMQLGFTKKDIRILSHAFGLSTWDHPSSPCLASRIPYGTSISAPMLKQIGQGEAFLHQLGFRVVRVRVHSDLARIEVEPSQFPALVESGDKITAYFKSLGFLYVTLDLTGYRQGSMNEGLNL
jgi:pyridinium-3,5-biscarboxylic acid mononucleotide sulfurtransferase